MSFGFEAPEQASMPVDQLSGWPALSTGEFRQHRRIPEQFEEATLADSLNRSCAEIQMQLLNYAQNSDVPFSFVLGAPEFNEIQTSIYRGAVYARSHADLLGYFATVDMQNAGNNKAQDGEQQNILLAQSNRAVRLLLGLGRCGVHSL